jgi:hypothetical protein
MTFRTFFTAGAAAVVAGLSWADKEDADKRTIPATTSIFFIFVFSLNYSQPH